MNALPSLSSCVHTAIAGGAVLCTANQRLAEHYRECHDQWRLNRGERIWEDPAILPLEAWIYEIAVRYAPLVPAPSHVERICWEQIVAEDQSHDVLDTSKLAADAMKAYAWLHLYGIEMDKALAGRGGEAEALLRWARAVERKLARLGMAPLAKLGAQVPNWILGQALPLPERMILAGFVAPPPSYRRLFEALQQVGVRIEAVRTEGQPKMCRVWRCMDEEEEGRWLAARILACFRPGIRIGVAVPDLHRRSARLQRILRQELDPSGRCQPGVVDFSLGDVLARKPSVRKAMQWLEALGSSTIDGACMKLLIDAIACRLEEKEHLRLLQQMHEQCLQRVPLSQWLDWLSAHAGQPALALRDLVEGWPKGTFLPSQWLKKVDAFLQQMGWEPCEDAVLREWREAQHVAASLDGIQGAVNWATFRSLFFRVLQERPVRPPPGGAEIRVMGFLECVGQRFDRLFVLGMHEKGWPQPPRPHPMIPIDLQKAYGFPHADAVREHQYAVEVWRNLLSGTEIVEAMYGAMEEHEGERLCSPLVSDWPTDTVDRAPSRRAALAWMNHKVQIERRPYPKLPLDALQVAGGVSVLTTQSECPFKAFAMHRLGLSRLEDPPYGVDPRLRGIFLHRLMERIWRKLQDKEGLDALVSTSIRNWLEAEAKACIAECGIVGMSQARIALEALTLAELASRWLEKEMQRSGFRVVHREASRFWQIGPLRLQVRIDRLDVDAQERKIVIDYKTGNPPANAWVGERPADAQLPAYALAFEADAAAFALLRRSGMRFYGLASAKEMLPDVQVSQDWEAQCRQWRLTLERLATEYAQGVIEARPRDDRACKPCAYASLCRIRDLEHA